MPSGGKKLVRLIRFVILRHLQPVDFTKVKVVGPVASLGNLT